MRRSIVICLLGAVVSIGLLTWWAADGNGPSRPEVSLEDRRPLDGVEPLAEHNAGSRRDGGFPKLVTPTEQGEPHDRAPAQRKRVDEIAGPGVAAPFIATRLSSGSVAVDLSGGESELTSLAFPESKDGADSSAGGVGNCQIHGLVSDAQGRVGGAAVLAGKSLNNAFGNVVGSTGSSTDERGWFELPVECGQATQVIALHHRRGWSKPEAVSVEQGSIRVDITLELAGRIQGRVTRGGLPERADLRLVASGSALELGTETDASGSYQFTSVPAGKYELVCGIAVGGGGNIPSFERSQIEVPSGKIIHKDIELGDGTLVVVHLEHTEKGDDVALINVALLSQEQAVRSAEQVLAYLDTKAGRQSHQVLVGGSSIEVPIQFHNVDSGHYRLCVVSRSEKPPRLACQHLSVQNYQAVVEVGMEL